MTIGVLTSCMLAKFNVVCVFNDPHPTPSGHRKATSHTALSPLPPSASTASSVPLISCSAYLYHVVPGFTSPSGAAPVGYHAVNIVLHVLVTVLFARMCTRIVGPRLHEISAVASFMFATHPIHVEAVRLCVLLDKFTAHFMFAMRRLPTWQAELSCWLPSSFCWRLSASRHTIQRYSKSDVVSAKCSTSLILLCCCTDQDIPGAVCINRTGHAVQGDCTICSRMLRMLP